MLFLIYQQAGFSPFGLLSPSNIFQTSFRGDLLLWVGSSLTSLFVFCQNQSSACLRGRTATYVRTNKNQIHHFCCFQLKKYYQRNTEDL